MGSGPGFPGWFVALFVIFAVVAIGTTIWRVSLARRMAEDAGLDPNRATAVAMLGNDGIDATYLAASLAAHSRAQSPPAPHGAKSTKERLQELQALKDKGLVSDGEYEAQRQKILGSI